jgi:uncharacterized membrane protein
MCGLGYMTVGDAVMGALTLAVLTGALLAAVAIAVRSAVRRPAARLVPTTPLEIVKERYARGYIDHAQLDRELDRVLRRHDPGSPSG